MVTQWAFSPKILKGKATIPWVETRAGAPISEMNEQLGLVRWRNWIDARVPYPRMKVHTGSNPVLITK
jgi:hypothetical protein